MRFPRPSWRRHLLPACLLLFAWLGAASTVWSLDLQQLFAAACADPGKRPRFIKAYANQRSLPPHVLTLRYSPSLGQLALTNPLRRTASGDYTVTTNTWGMGKGYPSVISFGSRMFNPAYNLADFENALQHEAAHAAFWATARLNYMDEVDTDQARTAKGVLPVLFELDAIQTQKDHPSWPHTSAAFRQGQEAYRRHWLEKLERLREQLEDTNLRPLLERIWDTYR